MLSPDALPGGGEVGASGLIFWIARAGGQKVTIRTVERGWMALVPQFRTFFAGARFLFCAARRLALTAEQAEAGCATWEGEPS